MGATRGGSEGGGGEEWEIFGIDFFFFAILMNALECWVSYIFFFHVCICVTVRRFDRSLWRIRPSSNVKSHRKKTENREENAGRKKKNPTRRGENKAAHAVRMRPTSVSGVVHCGDTV